VGALALALLALGCFRLAMGKRPLFSWEGGG